jgi:transcriptional regulator with XRE-family HTH domain
MTKVSSFSEPVTAGAMLRQWRDLRGKPQLTLALDTGISQKHVSFVETGRSIPSRQMIVDLADALDIPMRDRNEILTAAGYAPTYGGEPLDAPEMAAVQRAIARMLRQHEPYPAVVMDRYWNVIETNRSAPAFFGRFIDMSKRPKPRNLLHLMFDPGGMRPFLLDWEETARSLLWRLRREAVGKVFDKQIKSLIAELATFPDFPQDMNPPATSDQLPMLPVRFRTDGGPLTLFSMITTVGAPQTITAEELRLETMFPCDDETEILYAEFMGQKEI